MFPGELEDEMGSQGDGSDAHRSASKLKGRFSEDGETRRLRTVEKVLLEKGAYLEEKE